MPIRNFTDSDIKPATNMSMAAWAFELEGHDEAFREFIYEYIVRYYDLNREFSLSLEDEEGVQAILLAGLKNDANQSLDWFNDRCGKFGDACQKIARQYKAYLEYNSRELKPYVGEDDLIMNLFISRKPGYGKALLTRLEELGRQNDVSGIWLWSDATCNLHYYAKQGFAKVYEFHNHLLMDQALTTIVYRKSLPKQK